GNDPGNEDDLVFSSYDLAKAWQKKGRTKQADDAGKAAIAAWRKMGATKNTQGAKWAGEWALTFVERDREKTWVPYAWKVGARNKAELQRRKDDITKLAKKYQDQYTALDDYGVLEYSMAAKVRFAEVGLDYVEKFTQQPTPTFILDLDKRNPDANAVAAY